MKISTVLTVSMLAIGWQVSTAHAADKLERKFAEGTAYKNSVEVQSIQSLKLNDMDIDTNVSQTLVIETSIGSRGGDGQLPLDHKIVSLRTQMKIPNLGEISFDSAKPNEATDSPLTPIFKATANSTWQTIIGKDNEVVSVKGRDDILNELDDGLKQLVKGQFDSEYLTAASRQEAARIPANPVEVDDAWDLTQTLRVDGSQTLTFEKTYTYKGIESYNGKDLARIDVKATSIKYDILPNGPIPLKVSDSNLNIGETSGKIYFDRELGRVVVDEQSHQVVGEFTLEINDMKFAAVLDLRMNTKSREE
ncbi:MAG: DUF6263 family protein [Planctomycetota bacterium]|nr:DUF6263 family protein [Planctomycetota bacterium]MDA1211079.1 DUF6263 family protein [Planctomycetota bacterium]